MYNSKGNNMSVSNNPLVAVNDLELVTLVKRLSLTDAELDAAQKEGKISELFQGTLQTAERETKEAAGNAALMEKTIAYSKEDVLAKLQPQAKAKWLEYRRIVLTQYAAIFQKYTINPNGKLMRKQEEVPLHVVTFLKVIKVVSGLHLGGDQELRDQGQLLKVDNTEFIAKLENGKIHIVHYPGVKIGEGYFSIVYKAWSVSHGVFKALKVARNGPTMDRRASAEKALFNEVRILNHIKAANGGKTPEGIQHAPAATFKISKGDARVFAYVGKLYECDLFDWTMRGDVTKEQRIECCKQLMKAYKATKDLRYRHADIKPDNIYKLKGKDRFVIGDWGNALCLTRDEDENYEKGNTTPAYANRNDAVALFEAANVKNAKLFQIAMCNHEIYSLGTTMFAVLTQNFPYPMRKGVGGELQSADLSKLFRKEVLVGRQYSEAVIKVVKRMVEHSPVFRLKLEEAVKAWGEIS